MPYRCPKYFKIKNNVLACFWIFFVDIHHRLRPRRGLGRLVLLLGGKNAADFYILFSTFLGKSWFTSHYLLNDLLHSPSKTNSFVFVFVYYCESQQASLRKIGPAGHPAGQVGFLLFKFKFFNCNSLFFPFLFIDFSNFT